MQTLPISTAKSTLSELVESAVTTRNQVTITKNGVPAAVLVSADEWESIQETLYWQSVPGIHEDLAEADADIAAGRVFTEEQIRADLAERKAKTKGRAKVAVAVAEKAGKVTRVRKGRGGGTKTVQAPATDARGSIAARR